MDAAAPQWLIALEASGAGAAIRQSVWIYPAANVAHVVSIVLFAGAVAVIDLTLLGVLRPSGRLRVLAGARRWAMTFFALVVATGLVLFVAEASHVALNRVFQVKLVLIGLALMNGLLLGARAEAAITRLSDDALVPGMARAAAMASLALWVTVVALGRYIAYN